MRAAEKELLRDICLSWTMRAAEKELLRDICLSRAKRATKKSRHDICIGWTMRAAGKELCLRAKPLVKIRFLPNSVSISIETDKPVLKAALQVSL